MRIFKILSLGFILLVIVSSSVGYIYFDRKFTPPDNYLSLSEGGDSIAVKWVKNEMSPIAAILLPVTIKGIPEQFYMQFDLGSHSTLFYKNSLESVFAKYPEHTHSIDTGSNTTAISFMLGKINVKADKFRLLNYGKPLKQEKGAVNIIGTLGADLIEKKITIIDFKNELCYFGDIMPVLDKSVEFNNFEFKKRKVLLPAKIDNKNYDLLYDTGSSAFELITNKELWEKFSVEGAQVSTSETNSQGRSLQTHTTKTNKVIAFGTSNISLNEVTYVEGYTQVQYLMMRLSGMGGMIGNKIFINKRLIIDCRNQKYAVY